MTPELIVSKIKSKYPGLVPLYVSDDNIVISRISTLESSSQIQKYHRFYSSIFNEIKHPDVSIFEVTQGMTPVALFMLEKEGKYGSHGFWSSTMTKAIYADIIGGAIIAFVYDWLGLDGHLISPLNLNRFKVPILVSRDQVFKTQKDTDLILQSIKKGASRLLSKVSTLDELDMNIWVPPTYDYASTVGNMLSKELGSKLRLEGIPISGKQDKHGIYLQQAFVFRGHMIRFRVFQDRFEVIVWKDGSENQSIYPDLVSALLGERIVVTPDGWEAWLDDIVPFGGRAPGVPDISPYLALRVVPPPLFQVDDFRLWAETLEIE